MVIEAELSVSELEIEAPFASIPVITADRS
jgi:hypothetical protein